MPKLPLELVIQAFLPLPDPTNTFFAEALSSADNFDESDFGRWDLEPPYPPALASDVPGEVYTKRLADIMHGRRLRQQREHDRAWAKEYRGASLQEQRGEILLESKAVLEKWKRLDSFLPEYRGGAREVRMAAHLQQWYARTVYHLYEKWKMII